VALTQIPDFVFDRTAESRVIKCLTIVDDATHEAVAIEVERAISGHGLTRVLDRLALSRGLPRVIGTDNGKEFCGKAIVTWAHERGVQLRLIEPGKPNQNAYIESFNSLRDECLNEHWFTHLLHARTGLLLVSQTPSGLLPVSQTPSLGVMMKPEVVHVDKKNIQWRVQA
jgi:transposase InsO family protein